MTDDDDKGTGKTRLRNLVKQFGAKLVVRRLGEVLADHPDTKATGERLVELAKAMK